MKIVIAPDSFKGSLSAQAAANAIRQGLEQGLGASARLVCCPIADGGEGTLDALVPREGRQCLRVTGPRFRPVEAEYGFLGEVAVIEMASAAGLTLIDESERRAGEATTRGVGELIAHALNGGCRRLMLTVGGSATNDGGCGMLAALGAVFRRENGEAFLPTGSTLSEIASVELSGLHPALLRCEITVATDVKNPLTGPTGATMVYGRQKGATEAELAHMEAGMCRYLRLLEGMTGRALGAVEGCGAGGGIALPLLAFANARIRSGIETVLDANGFREQLRGADLVITGEGRLDAQSLFGKTVSGVTNAASALGVPVICLAGCLGDDEETLKSMGIREIRTVASLATSVEDSMQNAHRYLAALAYSLVREGAIS